MKRTWLSRSFGFVSLIGLICGSATAQNGDFKYIANPPRKLITGIVPRALPRGRNSLPVPVCSTSVGPLICYSPRYIQLAYNYPTTLDGSGQTIVIVDAFGSPTIKSDLATFDATFGIPAPPSFTVFCPAGCPPLTSNRGPHEAAGWSVETSLDVEWAHAMAPGANIVLVVSPTSSGNALNVVETAAIKRYPGSIMSQSFGIPEFVVRGNRIQLLQAHKNYVTAAAEGMTVLAGTGDFGATNGLPIGLANPQFRHLIR